jgi:DNA-binding PadR family transcriptional regulator
MHRHHCSWKRREAFSRHGYGFGHRGIGRGSGRGGRIGRLLEHGDLRFVILALLKEKPGHGYEMIRALEERSGGAYRPSPGVIYPTLSLLEDEGFVRQTGEAGGRKAFEITEAGLAALEANRTGVEAVFARLEEAAAQSSSSRPRIARAMQNLGTALTLRLQREADEAQIDAIAAALDEAAGKIERA